MDTRRKAELLEAYGHAEADSAMLNVMLQSMANDTNHSMPGLDATIARSMARADREMHEIKREYEEAE